MTTPFERSLTTNSEALAERVRQQNEAFTKLKEAVAANERSLQQIQQQLIAVQGIVQQLIAAGVSQGPTANGNHS